MANRKRNKDTKKRATFTINPTRFKPGNELWRLAANPGRPRIFETPEKLWDLASEYFEWAIENPLIEIDYKGQFAEEVEVPKMRVFTWQALELYLGVYDLREYKTNPKYSEFSQVIGRIERVIYSNKFEGATAGFLNATIISRDLGLADKIDHTIDRKATGDLFPFGPPEDKS